MSRVGLAVLGAVLVVAGGAVLLWPTWSESEATTQLDRITAVRLAGDSGDVQVRHVPGGSGRVVQHRSARFWDGGGGTAHRVEGGTLVLADCGPRCHVDYEVELPTPVPVTGTLDSGRLRVAGMGEVRAEVGSGGIDITDIAGPVAVRTGSGSVSVRGVSGPVEARTGSGDIDVERVDGRLEAETGSGGISGEVGSEDVVAESRSGDVRLRLTRPRHAALTTGSGEIDLSVPAERYRVESSTGSGDVELGVAQDPAAERHLELSSGSGDIRVRS
ncbi:hypothetical protein EIL87_21815 [Saccharopolyspora rhizosphaerae]|uniref:DUF4097 domain-containing protein n=1 Tax=Saccharopolyspora rhizosphaerae TaxID=2492662 RepID=A0A3R8QJ37_9PSEU|nr:DUF4097 family beta strand repeat-containing protein [Saccharopolyspora rhizosphaerae]RRO13638.1 hypothetical protein EIL87_21815 [Saccharopolyspora rhizosphaerae]